MVDLNEKWMTHTLSYANDLKKVELEDWERHFFQTVLLNTNTFFMVVIELIEEFDLKLKPFNPTVFKKKLFKKKKRKVIQLYKVFLMDYMSFLIHETYNQVLITNSVKPNDFLNLFFDVFNFNEKEKEQFKTFQDKNNTIYHTVYLLEKLSIQSESNNEALIESIELIKEDTYGILNNNLQKFLNLN